MTGRLTDRDPRNSLFAFIQDGFADRHELASGGLTSDEAAELREQRDSLTAENARLKEGLVAAEQAVAIMAELECTAAIERDKLKEQLADKERDSERLDYLDALVKHPPFRCDVILQHDHEDGVWLASIERGRAYGVTSIDSDISTPHLDVRAAIDSAAKERPLHIAPAAEGVEDES